MDPGEDVLSYWHPVNAAVRHPLPHPPVSALSTRSLFALAVFVLGGLVAPSVHQAWHAEEWASERAQHVAEGHHHHDADHAHVAELDAPCPEPALLDLQCVLCHGVSIGLPVAPATALAPTRPVFQRADATTRANAAPSGLLSIRGPPEPVT